MPYDLEEDCASALEKPSDPETFLGGSMFTGLGKGYSNIYGIYTTSRRIVGVKASAGPYVLIVASTLGILVLFSALATITQIPLLFVPALVLIIVLGVWIQRRSGKKNPTTIVDLDARKDFEMFRENISRIELKKAGMRGGHLKIEAVDGSSQNLRIGAKIGGGYESLKGLLQEFCSISPQVAFMEGE
jgi:hypothetical protein